MTRLIPAAFLVALVLAASSARAAGATWYVKPDGSGDAATIQAAVYAAASGDTIILADGTFTGNGNRDIELYSTGLTIRSESGIPAQCVIDCGGSISEEHGAFDIRIGGEPHTVLVGFTVRNGYASSAGAIYITPWLTGDVTVTIANCVFADNASPFSGGAIIVWDGGSLEAAGCQFVGNSSGQGGAIYLTAGSSAVMIGCVFQGNQGTAGSGGAVLIAEDGTVSAGFTDCSFIENTASHYGGAVYAGPSTPLFYGCTFWDNAADWAGGALYLGGGGTVAQCLSLRNHVPGAESAGASLWCGMAGSVVITRSTFVADSLGDGVIYISTGATVELDRTVIAFAKTTPVVCFSVVPPTLTCCDIYGNQFGDWVGCIADQAGTNGNISEDPKFCNYASGDVSVEDCSKCLAANNSCMLDIGKGGEGCACGHAVEPTTWGAIKATYR